MKILMALVLAVLVLSGCNTIDTPDTSPTPTPSFTDTLPNTTVLTTTTIEPTGTVLVDGAGRPLYVYLLDKDSEVSTCVVLCPGTYAPVMADDTVVAQGGVDENLVGVGGDGQVIYNGHLLYYYLLDTAGSTPSGVTTDFLLITPGGSTKGIS
jgi:predicted lipoprotein with Yx(FWY)xxD motif